MIVTPIRNSDTNKIDELNLESSTVNKLPTFLAPNVNLTISMSNSFNSSASSCVSPMSSNSSLASLLQSNNGQINNAQYYMNQHQQHLYMYEQQQQDVQAQTQAQYTEHHQNFLHKALKDGYHTTQLDIIKY